MGKFDEYLDKARSLAGEAGEVVKEITGEVSEKARELTEEGTKTRAFAENAKAQGAAFALGAKEKVQGVIQDAKTVKEISQGISELENLPAFEGSIIYTMELEAMINDLKSLMLFIGDNRLDDASVVEEIRKVMDKVQPAVQTEGGEAEPQAQAETLTDEQQAIERAKRIAYSACERALAVMN